MPGAEYRRSSGGERLLARRLSKRSRLVTMIGRVRLKRTNPRIKERPDTNRRLSRRDRILQTEPDIIPGNSITSDVRVPERKRERPAPATENDVVLIQSYSRAIPVRRSSRSDTKNPRTTRNRIRSHQIRQRRGVTNRDDLPIQLTHSGIANRVVGEEIVLEVEPVSGAIWSHCHVVTPS